MLTMNRNNITLGPKALEVVARLSYENKYVVKTDELESLFSKELVVRTAVEQLIKKKILVPITRGVYVFSKLEDLPNGRGINPYFVPNYIFPKKNYYIGYSTQYASYDFTTQIPQTVFILNTSFQEERIILGVNYLFFKIPENRMYGIENRNIDNEVVNFSDEERTLVDLFYFPGLLSGGGLVTAYKVLEEKIKKIDIDKFINYAVLFPNITTRKKIGYGLERLRVPLAKLQPLIESVKDTAYVPIYKIFNSKSRAGTYNKRWRAIVKFPDDFKERDCYNESEEEWVKRIKRWGQ